MSTEHACVRGLDDLHVALALPFDDPGALKGPDRDAAKELLFLCHYAATSCGWAPEKAT